MIECRSNPASTEHCFVPESNECIFCGLLRSTVIGRAESLPSREITYPREWEQIDYGYTHRMKTAGGWIVRYWVAQSVSLVYVPDPNGRWILDEVKPDVKP